jgi:hypothetical protein
LRFDALQFSLDILDKRRQLKPSAAILERQKAKTAAQLASQQASALRLWQKAQRVPVKASEADTYFMQKSLPRASQEPTIGFILGLSTLAHSRVGFVCVVVPPGARFLRLNAFRPINSV